MIIFIWLTCLLFTIAWFVIIGNDKLYKPDSFIDVIYLVWNFYSFAWLFYLLGSDNKCNFS